MSDHKTYQIGLIGAGMIARQHLENLRKTGRTEVTWIAAINPENLEAVRSKFNIRNKTHDYHDMLNDPGVDAILISTPPHLHKEMFIEALNAGKHVLVEKPLAIHLDDIDEMLDAKKRYPELIAMDCSGRHSRLTPKFRKVKEIIDSGVLGDKHELEKVESASLKSGLDDIDPGTDIYDVEEHFMVNLRMSNNVRYTWERGAHANMEVPNETRIYGTRGGIKLGYCSWDDPEITFYDLDEDGKAREQRFELDYKDQDDGFALSEHLIRVLDGAEEPVISLKTA
ncbi:MAG: Gfo/Idh/MocA family oxidoreductase [Bacteroidales bacterium]|nr:Gfo/Idh/MocA family oxidoreductase [Bacteroidales bacterium]